MRRTSIAILVLVLSAGVVLAGSQSPTVAAPSWSTRAQGYARAPALKPWGSHWYQTPEVWVGATSRANPRKVQVAVTWTSPSDHRARVRIEWWRKCYVPDPTADDNSVTRAGARTVTLDTGESFRKTWTVRKPFCAVAVSAHDYWHDPGKMVVKIRDLR